VSNADTPDNSRGAVATQSYLGVYGSGSSSETVTLPDNTVCLWIVRQNVAGASAPAVLGNDAVEWPVYPLLTVAGEEAPLVWLCPVLRRSASQVTVTWSPMAPDATWWLISDSGPRVNVDAVMASTVAAPGFAAPAGAVQVAGSDGTDLRALLVDSSGRLVTSGSGFPAVYAAPGAAIPADALMVGGSDGTDLRALSTDASGHPQTIDQNLKNVVGVGGVAEPSDAVQVAGSDGTDLRVLLTDATGKLQVNTAAFPAVYAAPAAAIPADALMVAGSDGTDLRALSTDASGHPQTIDQNLKLTIAAAGAAVPADVVQVGGSDGTDLRALSTDASGHPQTIDQNLKLTIAAAGAAVPADVVQVGGSDGTDLRALRTDQQGVPYAIPSAPGEATADRPPNELKYVSVLAAAYPTTLIAAPGAGKRIRLFYLQAYALVNTANYYVVCTVNSANVYAILSEVPAGQTLAPAVFPLTGLACDANTAVNIGGNAGTAGATAGYTIETI
jgi:lambda repressor-like predicted transcriptional regulator